MLGMTHSQKHLMVFINTLRTKSVFHPKILVIINVFKACRCKGVSFFHLNSNLSQFSVSLILGMQ